MIEKSLSIVNISRVPAIRLPVSFTPFSIEWDAKSNWAAIATIARNNPFYHYTGGEDTLSFELDWYAHDEEREEAILGAKTIRAWSRGDGYSNKPPTIVVEFEKLFRNDEFIIDSAPFTMSLFMRSNYTAVQGGGIADQQIRPVQVKQQLTLKKIASYNHTHRKMIEI